METSKSFGRLRIVVDERDIGVHELRRAFAHGFCRVAEARIAEISEFVSSS
jgi:hypothetical protein